MTDSILLLVFPLLMLVAAFSDLLTMRISNELVLVAAAAFFPLALFAGMAMPVLGMHVVAGLAVLAVTFTMFALGWIGGGDAKFAAATALWLGFSTLLPYLLIAALIGGGLTVALLVIRRVPLPEPVTNVGWIGRLHHPKTGIPYGIALAAAGLIVYSDTALYDLLTASAQSEALFDQLQSF